MTSRYMTTSLALYLSFVLLWFTVFKFTKVQKWEIIASSRIKQLSRNWDMLILIGGWCSEWSSIKLNWGLMNFRAQLLTTGCDSILVVAPLDGPLNTNPVMRDWREWPRLGYGVQLDTSSFLPGYVCWTEVLEIPMQASWNLHTGDSFNSVSLIYIYIYISWYCSIDM